MPDQPLKDTIFKFVSVRAPQYSAGLLTGQFVRFDSLKQSPFLKQVALLDGQANAPSRAVELAKLYLNDYAESDDGKKQVSARFKEIQRIEKTLSGAPAEESAVAPGINLSDLIESPPFQELKAWLW